MDNISVESDVPSDYWFKCKLTRCLLTTRVHRSKKEIAPEHSTLPPGATWVQQSANATQWIASDQEIAQKASKQKSSDDNDVVKKQKYQ
jgi:hypothetical protein